jgi:hypothetical protein
MRKIAFIVPLLVVFNISAQGQAPPEVLSIDAYVKTIASIRNKTKGPGLIFGDTAGTESDTEKWRKFPSKKALEAFSSSNEVYNVAFNWLSGGKIVQSSFTLSSPSGDSAKYNDHFFRDDGSLAMIESDYRTFLGNFRVVRRRYFDKAGKQIHMTTKFLDIKTNKRKKHADGVMGDDPDRVDYFLTTAKLPFASLLKGK